MAAGSVKGTNKKHHHQVRDTWCATTSIKLVAAMYIIYIYIIYDQLQFEHMRLGSLGVHQCLVHAFMSFFSCPGGLSVSPCCLLRQSPLFLSEGPDIWSFDRQTWPGRLPQRWSSGEVS